MPVGYVWGEAPGEVLCDPNEEVVLAIRNVFARFAELGAAWRVWLWFLDEGLSLPARNPPGGPLRWVRPSFAAIRQLLTNPVYAGAYVFGKTRTEHALDAHGVLRSRRVRLQARSDWQVFLPDHHEGYVDWLIGKPTTPTWSDCKPTARRSCRPPGERCGRVPRCCRAWQRAVAAAVACIRSTAKGGRSRTTSARAGTRRDGAACA